MGYKRETIIKRCEKMLNEPKGFYKATCVNYTGRCIDTKEFYTEVISEFLCNHIDEYKKGIKTVTRERSYKVEGHDGEYDKNSNRIEEITAMKMFKYCEQGGTYDYVGKIIDYQTPLKNKRSDKENSGLGKIDLLSYDGELLHLLELKKPDSNETMLRCVLEGFTYLETVNKEKIAEDFGYKGAQIKASPFVFVGEESEPYLDMKEDRPWLKKLMELLDSKPYYIVENNDGYKVEEELR